jgi:hypothetical protein
MKRFELILAVAILLGLVMKLLHLPMSSFLLVLSMSALSMSYWFGALWFGKPGMKDGAMWLSLVAGLACSSALVAILFKLQYWPFRDGYLLFGSVACAASVVGVLVSRARRPELEAYHRSILRRVMVIGIPTVLLLFTPSEDMARYQYRDDPAYAELFVRSLEHPEDTAIRNAMDRHRTNRMLEESRGN